MVTARFDRWFTLGTLQLKPKAYSGPLQRELSGSPVPAVPKRVSESGSLDLAHTITTWSQSTLVRIGHRQDPHSDTEVSPELGDLENPLLPSLLERHLKDTELCFKSRVWQHTRSRLRCTWVGAERATALATVVAKAGGAPYEPQPISATIHSPASLMQLSTLDSPCPQPASTIGSLNSITAGSLCRSPRRRHPGSIVDFSKQSGPWQESCHMLRWQQKLEHSL